MRPLPAYLREDFKSLCLGLLGEKLLEDIVNIRNESYFSAFIRNGLG